MSSQACINKGDACKKRETASSRVQGLHALHAFLLMPPEKFLGMTEQADIVISVRELMRSSRRRVSGKGLGSQIEFLKFGIEKYVLAG